MDTFDAEYERIQRERKDTFACGVLPREDAAAEIVTASSALLAEAKRLEEYWWEDGDEAVFTAIEAAIAAWRAAVAYRGDDE